MASITAHTLYWPNTDSQMLAAHKEVFKYFDFPINYTCEKVPHGEWMDRQLNECNTDMILFVDVDCVPTSSKAINRMLSVAWSTSSFAGPAQATNCNPNYWHIFAAPSFLAVSLSCWRDLGQPSLSPGLYADAAQNLSIVAEKNGVRYTAVYPLGFDDVPIEGLWRLGNYGHFGIGTLYQTGIYHLFQGRLKSNINLFLQKCESILCGTLEPPRYSTFDSFQL